MRTLEMKIADAGPYGQRIDPHILTTVRKEFRNLFLLCHESVADDRAGNIAEFAS